MISLTCRHDGCKNNCYLDEGVCKLPVLYIPHNHATKANEYKELCVLNAIKNDCANAEIMAKIDTKTSAVKSIFKETIKENESSTVQFHKIERTLRRIASKTMPAAPKSINDIGKTFENESVRRLYGQTMHKENTHGDGHENLTHN